jgi:hypothetical protein
MEKLNDKMKKKKKKTKEVDNEKLIKAKTKDWEKDETE